MLIPVFLRKVTKYGANGKKRMHQLSFPCRHLTLAPAPTPLRTNAPTLTHLLQHFHASAPPHSRIRATTHAHLRLRRCAPTTPLSRICAYAAAHLRHHSHTTAPSLPRTCAQATLLSRTYDTTLAHLRLRRCAQAHPLPSRVAFAPSVFRTLFYVALRSSVCTFSTNSFKYSYKSF